MVDIIIQIDRLCTYMTHEKHLKIFFVISFFDLITLLRNFHATKKSVDDIIVKNWVCRWETLLNIKIFGLSWGISTLRMFMYYAFMNTIQGRSTRENNCNFVLVSYAMKYQSYSKAVSIMLYIKGSMYFRF